ncbi:MAG: rRNA maturation RNase YbeY [Planctomycetaceae bacterium]|nr:rRNA maturation RNase YbeY [Planctomycetaceae bacterium]
MSELPPEFNDDYDDFPPGNAVFLEILNEQEEVPLEEERIRSVCEKILADAGIVSGRLGVVVVDNETIYNLNRDFLQHDYPTDVISFQTESEPENGYLEGEVIVSAEMAQNRAPEFGWSVKEELILYVIHGLLHLVGFDDMTAEDSKIMREKERYYLRHAGFEPNDLGFDFEPEDDSPDESVSPPEEKGEFFLRLYDEDVGKN